MRYFKPVFFFRFVCVAVLFSSSLHAQEGIDVVLQKYSNEQAVITNFEDRLEIKNEKGTLVARSYVSTEKLLIGALSPGIYNKEYIFHSYFSTLEDFDASALVPGKKGYVKNDASATKTSRYEDNEVLYDDNQQTEISFSGLSPKSLMRTSYTLVHNDLHMLPTAYLQDNLPIARLKYVVTVPKYVQVKFVIKGVLAGKVKQAMEETKNTVTYTFSAEDVPALKRYDFIHSSEWYMLHIIPYVVSYKLPGDDSAQTLGDVSHLYGYLYNFIRDVNTNDDKIKKLRLKQMKNAMALTMLSLGVPMINSGDEFCKTQKGNNNAYSQDNEISWLDWSLFEKNKGFFRFVKNIIGFRKNNTSLRRRHFYNVPEGIDLEKFRDLTWYGEKGEEPNWKPDNYTIAFLIKGWTPIESSSEKKCHDIYVIINSHWETHSYILPKIKEKKWFFICDTDKEAPYDIVDPEPGKSSLLDNQNDYTIQPRSVVILTSKEVNSGKKKT